jgi:nucleotide-binding universal stress UspA family protein
LKYNPEIGQNSTNSRPELPVILSKHPVQIIDIPLSSCPVKTAIIATGLKEYLESGEWLMEIFKRILVICRMNPYSQKTIETGISLARTYKAKLFVLHLVSDPVELMTMNASGLFPEAQYTSYFNNQREAKEQMDMIIKQESGLGFPIHELVSERDSAENVLTVIREEKIDLLLMNAHEEGRIEHALFGGKDDALLRMMPCSILLVKNEPGVVYI